MEQFRTTIEIVNNISNGMSSSFGMLEPINNPNLTLGII